MTIAAAYLTSEGVIFGADSTTTWASPLGGVLQLFNHAQKIFEVGPPQAGRMAICTWGEGRAGQTSHRTIAARLHDGLTPSTEIDEASDKLIEIVNAARTGTTAMGTLGYLLGGCSPKSRDPACDVIEFSPGGVSKRPLAVGQCIFQGAPEIFMRAYHGFDPRLPSLVRAHLQVSCGPQLPADFDGKLEGAFNAARAQIPHGGLADLPLREAIDFLHMYLYVTIKALKFRIGPPICGGPIELGFISTDRPFRWVRHKRFDSAVFEADVGELP